MRSQTIRLAIFISTLVIAAIIIFQVIWLNKVYHREQKQFNQGIARALRGFYDDIRQPVDPKYNLNQLVSSTEPTTFIARMTAPVVCIDSVLFYMQNELEGEDIFTDCYAGLYDASQKKYVLQGLLAAPTEAVKPANRLPSFRANYNYLLLYFPHLKQFILSRLNFWLISSVLLLIVLILFGASLYYFYRQTFLNEMQKDFVNNFTHEFKTPVAVIKLAAEVLENPDISKKPEKLSKYAHIVKYQGNYLQKQIENLLKQAYSESNHIHLQKQRVSLQQLVKEAIINLQPLIDEKNAGISYEFNAGKDELWADHNYLVIVVTNLIENALKYSEEPKIIIQTYNENGHVVLSIKDNGQGIAKKHHQKIFKKFYRVPNGDQMVARGFGLGLPFSKRIVQAHHGKVEVESIPKVGSNFIITLPLS